MSLVFRFAARSNTGVVRSKNDDSGYAGRYFAVVADGMGGHAGGNVASASTVLDLAHLDTRGFTAPDTVLPDEIQTANAFLNRLVQANPKLAGMGTTITSLLITDDRMQFAHIGDSRAYRLKKGRFRQVSKDHTFVQRLVDEGRLDPAQAEHHPHRNVLMRVLGDVDASPELDITSFPVEAGERWMLCSDGLNAVVSDRLIEQKLRSTQSLESIVDDLVDLTIEGGAPDNVTVVCLEVVEADEGDLTRNRPTPLSPAAVASASEVYEPVAEERPVSEDEAADSEHTMEMVPVVNVDALSEHPPEDHDELSPLSASMLGQDLEARPHRLVGAAAQATETGMIPVVRRSVDEPVLAARLTGQPLRQVRHEHDDLLAQAGAASAATEAAAPDPHAPPASAERSSEPGDRTGPLAAGGDPGDRDVADEVDDELDIEDEIAARAAVHRPRRVGWLLTTVVGLVTVLLAAVLFLGYIWTQTQYYVGEEDGEVAVFNGVSQSLGPWKLSESDELTGISVDDLTAYQRERVSGGIPADSRSHADQIVDQLRESAGVDDEDDDEESDSTDEATDEATDGATEGETDEETAEARGGRR
ncbi:MAG: protein phosphatase 2C domain-containing protein [Nesterenkonia sp.]|nr:protein phosphatase 2C domain-containing protein [Nesterenkonia sp.]